MTYAEKKEREIETYKDITNVHELPKAFHYYVSNYLYNKLEQSIGVSSFEELVIKYLNLLKLEKDETSIFILSLGSGNCDFETKLAQQYGLKCKFYCYDINPHALERGRQLAGEKELINFKFVLCDINKIEIHQNFDLVLANHSLHHLVDLEHIFSEVDKCMTEKSYFIINDMIGRNGHMFWDNTLHVCNAIWNMFPRELKYNHQFKCYYKNLIQFDCSAEGFEGIRAQDILPLLDKTFQFVDFAPFFAIAGHLIGREYGHNFDINNDFHKALLNMIGSYDNFLLENKLLKPTQLIAVMTKMNKEKNNTQPYKYLYFDVPKEIYMQDDKKIWDYLDKKSLKRHIHKRRICRIAQSLKKLLFPPGSKRHRIAKWLFRLLFYSYKNKILVFHIFNNRM